LRNDRNVRGGAVELCIKHEREAERWNALQMTSTVDMQSIDSNRKPESCENASNVSPPFRHKVSSKRER